MFSQPLLLVYRSTVAARTSVLNSSFIQGVILPDPHSHCVLRHLSASTNELGESTLQQAQTAPSCPIVSTASENVCFQSASDVDRPDENTVKEPLKEKKRTYAILLGYFGTRYSGVQYNDDMPTIENELSVAFCKAGLAQKDSDQAPLRTLLFNRASRTDKRVSAVQQLASIHCLLQPADIPKLKQSLNESLPDDIRVFEIRHAIKNFSPRFQCNMRTYTYTLPSFAFAHEDEQTDSTFKLTEERIAEVNDILLAFFGTHNFFNFTNERQDKTERTIKSFILLPHTRVHSNVEFATFEVTGTSFMMYQIRKMLGVTLAIIRGVLRRDLLGYMYSTKIQHVPLAPGLGLVLDSLRFDGYNRRFSKSHGQLAWDNQEHAELKQFKEKILSNIIQTELKDNLMLKWLNCYLPAYKCDFLCSSETESALIDEDITDEKELIRQKNAVVMYTVLRRDFTQSVKRTVASMVADASHASTAVIWKFKNDPYVANFMQNCNSVRKVVVVPSETQLLGLSKVLDDAGILHELWLRQPSNVPTCIAVKPMPEQLVLPYFKDLEELDS